MDILNQKIGQPPKPILSERPGSTYKKEEFTFFKPRTIYTKEVFENGEWAVYDKETGDKIND